MENPKTRRNLVCEFTALNAYKDILLLMFAIWHATDGVETIRTDRAKCQAENELLHVSLIISGPCENVAFAVSIYHLPAISYRAIRRQLNDMENAGRQNEHIFAIVPSQVYHSERKTLLL